ncbi:MAG: proteinase IV [Clostridiaceae bacterium]|nr:proteinase IV [Clostridiaceae bacterium]
MKKVLASLSVIVLLINLLCITAFADVLPAPYLSLKLSNFNLSELQYLDLLTTEEISGVKYDDFGDYYDEKVKEEPIYKYCKDGWFALMLRNDNVFEASNKEGRSIMGNIPKSFRIIVQDSSKDLFVSRIEYEFSNYSKTINIDFQLDMEKVGNIEQDMVYGDVNGDMKFNSTDYSMVGRYILSTIEKFPSPNGFKAADVNGDGKVNSIDYSYMKRRILDLIDKFPVEEIIEEDSDDISSVVLKGNSKFAFDIFSKLNKEDEDNNVFISPFSISTALSMALQGARDKTKDEMTKTLGYDGVNIENINLSYRNLLGYLNQEDGKVKLNISNSLWLNQFMINDKIKVNPEFISVNEQIFDATTEVADFSVGSEVERLNNWVTEATNGMIPGMVNQGDVINSIMSIINAIYFKGDWSEKFDEKYTYDVAFSAEDGTATKVKMMRKSGKIGYGEGEDFKAVKLPYSDDKLSMYCVLPQEGTTINKFIEGMDSSKWEEIRKSISTKQVSLKLPKFKMEYGIKSLKESLTALGMNEAFGKYANFSGMCEGTEVAISDVLHKAVIEVNETGTEASGSTVVIVTPTAIDPDTKEFTANRPFLFVIADDEYGTVLFMGKVSKLPTIEE